MVRRFTLVAALTALMAGMLTVPALAHNGETHVPPIETMPTPEPRLGLVYKGLKIARTGPCVGAFKLGNSNRCTHGPDAAPEGVDVKADVLPIRAVLLAPLPKVQCDGDGVSGKRVQVIYAVSSDKANRYAQYVNSIRLWAAGSDEIYRDSAAETSGERHIRFVHSASCVLNVANVTMSPTGDDNFTNTQVELAAQGFNLATRKYMVFVDANVYCGIGNIKNDDSPGAGNLNNGGPSYGRTDSGCWGDTTPAHELMHNIGGVQLSAPHSSGGWHCTDEWDLECYSDSPYYPAMSYLCNDVAHNRLFDCNHDDYYRTGFAFGYLATHWNSANSQYLVNTKQAVWGYVWANDPTAGSYTPSAAYQRNSTGALNTITRTGVGSYTVNFENLGIYYGGTVNVTAYGIGSETCKVLYWDPVLADQLAHIRCLHGGGRSGRHAVRRELHAADRKQQVRVRLGEPGGRGVVHAEPDLPVQLDRGLEHDHALRRRHLPGRVPGPRRAGRHRQGDGVRQRQRLVPRRLVELAGRDGHRDRPLREHGRQPRGRAVHGDVPRAERAPGHADRRPEGLRLGRLARLGLVHAEPVLPVQLDRREQHDHALRRGRVPGSPARAGAHQRPCAGDRLRRQREPLQGAELDVERSGEARQHPLLRHGRRTGGLDVRARLRPLADGVRTEGWGPVRRASAVNRSSTWAEPSRRGSSRSPGSRRWRPRRSRSR